MMTSMLLLQTFQQWLDARCRHWPPCCWWVWEVRSRDHTWTVLYHWLSPQTCSPTISTQTNDQLLSITLLMSSVSSTLCVTTILMLHVGPFLHHFCITGNQKDYSAGMYDKIYNTLMVCPHYLVKLNFHRSRPSSYLPFLVKIPLAVFWQKYFTLRQSARVQGPPTVYW